MKFCAKAIAEAAILSEISEIYIWGIYSSQVANWANSWAELTGMIYRRRDREFSHF